MLDLFATTMEERYISSDMLSQPLPPSDGESSADADFGIATMDSNFPLPSASTFIVSSLQLASSSLSFSQNDGQTISTFTTLETVQFQPDARQPMAVEVLRSSAAIISEEISAVSADQVDSSLQLLQQAQNNSWSTCELKNLEEMENGTSRKTPSENLDFSSLKSNVGCMWDADGCL